MERIQSRVVQLLQSGLASNSLSTYRTSVNMFEKFRLSFKMLSQWPIPINHVILFMAFCFEKGHSPKTITTYIAGLNYYHKLYGFYDINNVFMVNKLLEGCRRNRITNDCRAPLTIRTLVSVCDSLPSVCYNIYENKLFESLFTLAYYGLFRVSELVTSSGMQAENVLSLSDLTFVGQKEYAVIKLRHFKTNQRGTPVLLKIPRETGDLCPVNALFEFVSIRPRSKGPLFCHADGSPVTRTQFSAVLTKCVNQSNLSDAHFTSHSFRIGRATDLATKGYPSSVIMKLGRWTSQAFRLYIRP